MTPERWQEIDRVLSEALDREPAERASFLGVACGDDLELRREVESLLANDLPNTIVGNKAAEEATQLLQTHGLKNEIGPYQVIRSLGVGGMGSVFLAHDNRLNRPVAVKLISYYTAAEEERVLRFRQEALAASALNHPNILTIYEVGEVDGNSFIATEFVDGLTLRELIDRGSLPVEKCIDIAKQVATALSAAHAAGIVHRDIKPPNVMVRTDGLVKILDFGVAKFTQPSNEALANAAVETTPGTVIGTAAYMSPEQARGTSIDHRSDIWSLGVIIYEMLTGRRPFGGKTALDQMSAVIERQPTAIAQYRSDVPVVLENIVFKALEKDRERRYQSATEILAELQECSKLLGSEGTQVSHSKSGLIRSSRPLSDSSIAVLPFVNVNKDPDNEYFCDGLSEELLNALARIKDLRVAARTSAFSFKGKETTVREIGRALNVNSVLEGSVRRSGNRLRISVQLINCENGYQHWAERYDREIQDIFDVQDEITLAIVDALKVKLLRKEKDALLKRYTDNVEAYQLYLKGRYYWWNPAPDYFRRSREYFERAVDADPTYALSYAGVSSYYGFGSAWGMVPPDMGWPKATEANAKALALDNTLAEVHANEGGINMVLRRDFAAAEQNFDRALEINPGFQEAHYIYSFYLTIRGRFDEAIAEAQEALDLDPFSVRLNHHLGQTFFLARRYAEAINQYQQAIELDTSNPQLHESLAEAYEQQGLHDEAIGEWQNILRLEGDSSGADSLRTIYANQGFEAGIKSIAKIKTGQLERKAVSGEYVPAIHLARAHLKLGNNDKALDLLTKACDERNVFALLIETDPTYDPLRSDERFVKLLRTANLTGKLGKAAVTDSKGTQLPIAQTSVDDNRTAQTETNNVSKRRITFLLVGVVLALLAAVGAIAYWQWTKRLSPIESLAVLPFRNETNNTDLDWLSEGMPDSLINSLSQIPHLSVKSRSSVFRYKGRDVDAEKVASELSVQAVLEGRVLQHGSDLTISLSLVDGGSGNQIWGEQYDRNISQIVTLQNEIARDVSSKLRVRLSGADQQKLLKDYTANSEAYELYLRGRVHVFKLIPTEIRQGISDFEHAIQLDPNYALAYVGLSEANRSLAIGSEENPNEFLLRAKEASEKALALDDSLSEAHTDWAATVFWYDRNWSAAEEQYKRALQLNPRSVDAHIFYAHLLSNTGRHDEALSEIRRARELDPVNPFVGSLEGQFLLHAGRFDEALNKLKETSALAPGFWFPHVFASSAYIEKGMYAEAVAEAHRATELSNSQTVSLSFEAVALARWGKKTEAQTILEKMLKMGDGKDRWVPPSHIALIYAALGNNDEAFTWLDKAFEQHDPKLAFLKVERKWDPIRSDPRFAVVMKRANF